MVSTTYSPGSSICSSREVISAYASSSCPLIAWETSSSRVPKIEYTVCRDTPAACAAPTIVTPPKPTSAMSPSVA